MNRTTRQSLEVLTFLTTLTLLIGGSGGGCSCDSGNGLGNVAPKIVAIPNPIVFDQVAVGLEYPVQLLLKNDGNAVLELKGAPVLTENSEDAETELILRAVMVPADCATGNERVDSTPNTVSPGECVSIDVVYVPVNLGVDTGSIMIASNDPANPELTVPINASASAPDIEVCVLKSDCAAETTCFDVGSNPLAMDFPLVQINQQLSCPIQITNKGGLPLQRLAWTFKSGNRRRDYTLNPEDLSTLGDLAPGAGVELMVDFKPRSGGPKEAVIELTSTDPDESAVTINVNGMGDGPKVCPDPFPVIDFGKVTVLTTATLDVALTNCGTMELSITDLAVQDQNGTGPSAEFKLGAATPAPPIVLAPGANSPVPVEFTPPTEGYFTGRLFLTSTDPVVPSGWVNIVGEGVVPPSCELQASTSTVSFGTAAPSSLGGTPVEKTLALSNPGELPCTGVGAQITAGQAVAFNIVGFPAAGPPWTLAPGDVVIFTLNYDPADQTGPDQGTLSFTANEISSPLAVNLVGTPVNAPSCDLSVTPKTGNFSFNECTIFSGITPRVSQYGAVRMNTDKVLPVTIENVGSLTCNITGVELKPGSIFGMDPTFTLVNGPNVMTVNGVPANQLTPGQSGQVDVKYSPVAEGNNCGVVWVKTNNNAFAGECMDIFGVGQIPGCYQVSLIGQGVRSAIEVIPGDVDFGVITVGCASKDTLVTVYNIGQAPLNLTKIYVDPATSPFAIVSAPPVPVAVPGGGSVSVRLKYQPPDTNTHTGLLVLESDAQNGNYLTVPLKGKGTNDPHQTDTFQQLTEPLVDVLWVIDNSCSMQEEQNGLANNGSLFLNHALSLSTDFQIGVTTTDMDDAAHQGRLQAKGGAPKIITRTTANAAGEFAKNVKQGTGGSGTEKGLDAAHSALSDPLVNDPAANLGFLRDDAKLVVIAVSDEEDQSTPPVDFYVDFLKNIKGYRNTSLMSFSSIVGYDEVAGTAKDCSSANGVASAGTRYVEVANRTGGLNRSICGSNWGQVADDLGLDAFGAKTEFFLTREAIASTVQVRVNGSVVTKTGNWSFDPATNSVIFEPTAVPAQGATVTVDYDTVCH